METQVVTVRYYNVLFYISLRSELDVVKFSYLAERIKRGDTIRLKDIFCWCKNQKLEYQTQFRYRNDFPLRANLWNFYSYLRGKVESTRIKNIG